MLQKVSSSRLHILVLCLCMNVVIQGNQDRLLVYLVVCFVWCLFLGYYKEYDVFPLKMLCSIFSSLFSLKSESNIFVSIAINVHMFASFYETLASLHFLPPPLPSKTIHFLCLERRSRLRQAEHKPLKSKLLTSLARYQLLGLDERLPFKGRHK